MFQNYWDKDYISLSQGKQYLIIHHHLYIKETKKGAWTIMIGVLKKNKQNGYKLLNGVKYF